VVVESNAAAASPAAIDLNSDMINSFNLSDGEL
jgi:hypothetical protein